VSGLLNPGRIIHHEGHEGHEDKIIAPRRKGAKKNFKALRLRAFPGDSFLRVLRAVGGELF
jgi:hypothetical protein